MMNYEDCCNNISNSGLFQLNQLTELKTLICGGYSMKITGTTLAELSESWKQLKKLSVSWLKNITDTDMLAISKNIQLTHLDIRKS